MKRVFLDPFKNKKTSLVSTSQVDVACFVEQVVQECKEIYENSLVDGNPPKAGFVFPKVKALSSSRGRLWRKLT